MEQSEASNNSHVGQAYLILRVGIGLSFALHGASRFGKTELYSSYIPDDPSSISYQASMILFAYLLMGAELIGGIMLMVGFRRTFALSLLSISTIFFLAGSVLTEAWQSFTIVLIFLFFLYWLFRNLHEDHLSFDRFLKT